MKATKKQVCTADKNVLSNMTILKLNFIHNHSVHSAHALSFRSVDDATKQEIFTLFCKGHSAASARHAHETNLMISCAEYEQDDQRVLADRAINPSVQDYSRLHEQWRKKEMGEENGPDMFFQLQTEIDIYNENNQQQGGTAKLQVYKNPCLNKAKSGTSSNSDDDISPPPRKKVKLCKRKQKHQPMVLAICTPLMSRAHNNIKQAREMVFIDATSSLDRYNSSVFIMSTSTPTSGIPLGVIVTSDEQATTIHRGLELLGEVLPEEAFNGKGVKHGPTIVMTDDSHTEREALHNFWPTANLLLCTFHFLQRRWTWLYDSKNHIFKNDRTILIEKVKKLVYTNTETELQKHYNSFLQSPEVKKYPKFYSHMQSLWARRREWAHCYCRTILIGGNHTNNYAEAGMRILKELIFSRVKAYNLVQIFYFTTKIMERYYQSKLLSVAHSRVDCFISLRYQGVNAKAYAKVTI
ncbi:uncharacterized protein LOC134180732 [Corticium candelabrum]|uniref:uncharacterized protein LOC134180732 n=1 Tax=Corticium candelabrum TaxID=121492 RepID=UPI002E260773|nr:uncharacterized protein LOC134180732 [Corticium candelabrum]